MKAVTEIVMRSVDELIPYVNNARTHSDEQITQIASSIKEFGFNAPIILDGANGVLAGHGRLLAAKKLGLKEVPCVENKDLTEAQKKAYILADNKIALNSGWNEELLKIEFEDLKLENFNLDLTGFDSEEIEGLFDAVPALDDKYTLKVETPQYEIKGEKPTLKELFNSDKTNALIARIEQAKIPQDIKDFLKLASYRHTVFNYTNIAEYYANAPKEVQALFEDSALVIIDFNDAIKKGFVKLKDELAEQLESEND